MRLRNQTIGSAILLLLLATAAVGQPADANAPTPTNRTPPAATSQPATDATTQPAAAEELIAGEKQEAQLVKELAESELAKAQADLDTARADRAAAAESGLHQVAPMLAIAQTDPLLSDEAFAERQVQLQRLRREYAERRDAVAERKLAIEQERQTLQQALARAEEQTQAERSDAMAQYRTRADAAKSAANELWPRFEEARNALPPLQELQRKLAERLAALPEDEEANRTRVRSAQDQVLALINNQRLIGYAYMEQAYAESGLADAYGDAATQLREINERFWNKHAWLLNVGWILIVACAAHVGLNLLSWAATGLVGMLARATQRGAALPTVKRGRTLVQFARSIAKLLVWVVALVTILAEFGIQPGQSAGALGVIGLVLAGMFQQLVIDFVKGIDIAIGGHYFVGDFIQVAGNSGHVLDFSVKFTVLRTPSGQVITLPNSQCVPSRRFPAGFVDNYIDVPLAAGADVMRARRELDEVARALNERIEAIKRAPEIVDTFRVGDTTILRTRLRVLPTCDWVATQHYVPAVKRALAAADISMAGEPEVQFINDVPTFRRLFSRQMTDQEMENTLKAESVPTIARSEAADR